jgi:hypothetical protein
VSHCTPRRGDGAIYEINFLVWPLVFAVAGVAWGSRWGTAGAWIGGVLGVVAGFVTAGPYVEHTYYDFEFLAPWLLGANWLLPHAWRPWWLAGLCVAAWARIALGAVLARRRAHEVATP